MTREELVQKAEDKTITKEEIFEYYGVKNMDGLESRLAAKFDTPSETLQFLDGSLQYIYNTRLSKNYSPIQEEYLFYAICAKGIYGVDTEEISILNGYFGPFKLLMMLDAILKDKPEVQYMRKLYAKHIERHENIGLIFKQGVEELVNFAVKNLGDLDERKLAEIFQEFKDKANELIKEKE